MRKTQHKDLAHHLIKLSDHMGSVAAEMFDLSESNDSLVAAHAQELLGAANICREWAENLSTSLSKYKLPAGIFCRCRDNKCPQRQGCLRWLARNQGTGSAGFISEGTMRPAWADRDSMCRYFMEPIE